MSMQSPRILAGAMRAGVSLRNLIGMAQRARRVMRHRREVAQLMHLDDRMLADIGLTRQDVRIALSRPLFIDPSEQLIRCTHKRRHRQ